MAGTQEPAVDRVLRGYDPRQGDAVLVTARAALSGSVEERARAVASLGCPGFTIVLRGYDPQQTDALLHDLLDALSDTAPPASPPHGHPSPATAMTPDPVGSGSLLHRAGCKDRVRVGLAIVVGVLLLIIVPMGIQGNPHDPVLPWLFRSAGLMFMVMGLYGAVVRLEWSADDLAVVAGPRRRQISLRDLTDITHRSIRGGTLFILTDRHGHTLKIDDTLFNRQHEWKPALLACARAAGAHIHLGITGLLEHPDHKA